MSEKKVTSEAPLPSWAPTPPQQAVPAADNPTSKKKKNKKKKKKKVSALKTTVAETSTMYDEADGVAHPGPETPTADILSEAPVEEKQIEDGESPQALDIPLTVESVASPEVAVVADESISESITAHVDVDPSPSGTDTVDIPDPVPGQADLTTPIHSNQTVAVPVSESEGSDLALEVVPPSLEAEQTIEGPSQGSGLPEITTNSHSIPSTADSLFASGEEPLPWDKPETMTAPLSSAVPAEEVNSSDVFSKAETIQSTVQETVKENDSNYQNVSELENAVPESSSAIPVENHEPVADIVPPNENVPGDEAAHHNEHINQAPSRNDPSSIFSESTSADKLPWESTEEHPQKEPNAASDLFRSYESTSPMPWEASDPDSLGTLADLQPPSEISNKFAKIALDDDLLPDSEPSTVNEAEHAEPGAPETLVQSGIAHSVTESSDKDLFGNGKDDDDFSALISIGKADPVETREEKAKKFASLQMELDDDLLDDDFLEDIPKEPKVDASNTSKPAVGALQPSYEPVSFQQTQETYQYQPHQQTAGYGVINPYTTPHSPQVPQHHLDIQKLNENKKKSDAYDFPIDLMPHKPVHRPAKALSMSQTNQQHQHQLDSTQIDSSPLHSRQPNLVSTPGGTHITTSTAIDLAVSSALPPKNPYAPMAHPIEKQQQQQQQQQYQQQQYQQQQVMGVPYGGALQNSASNIGSAPHSSHPPVKKKQSSFFEELPLPPVAPAKTRATAASTASSSPMMGNANSVHSFGYNSTKLHAPPTGPPNGLSRPPSRPPVAPQNFTAVIGAPSSQAPIPSLNSAPKIVSTVPAQQSLNMHVSAQQFGPSNQALTHAPPAAQSPSVYAPSQLAPNTYAIQKLSNMAPPQGPVHSRYSPVVNPSSLGPPQVTVRRASVVTGSSSPGIAPPQPQLSHMINRANQSDPAALSVKTGASDPVMIQPQPGIHPIRIPPTPSATSFGSKSPNITTVTPSSTRYAPINHRRQPSSSAAQYDPYSAHKLQQKKIDEERDRLGVPAQGQLYRAPLQVHSEQSGYIPQGSGTSEVPLQPSQYAPPQAFGVTSHLQYAATTRQIANPEQLMSEQFPLFSWGNGSKVSYFIPPVQYNVPQSINVVKTEDVLQEADLKEFPAHSKKSAATIGKFLDTKLQELTNNIGLVASNAEILLLQLLKHKLIKDPALFNLGGTIAYGDSFSAHNSRPNVPAVPLNKRALVSLISSGQKQEILKLAIDHEDYSLGLLISSIISKESWFAMVEQYMNREFQGDEGHFLPILFRILAGDVENVVQLFASDPQRKSWAVTNWKALATSVITNNPPCLMQFLTLFGQFLIDNDELIAGYILFMIADAPLTAFKSSNSLSMTLYLEIYGFILQDKSLPADISHVLLMHASYLADYNMLPESQKLLDAANSSFKASKKVDPRFTYCSKMLSERLSSSGAEVGWFAKPKLDRVWGTLDKGLNKLISGDETQSDNKGSALFSKFSPNVSRSSSFVSMNATMGSDIQSYGRTSVSNQGGANPYTPGVTNINSAPLRSYAPAVRIPGTAPTGASAQSYAPPQFGKQHAVNSSPKPVRLDSTTSSPQPKTSRYAASTESLSRRSSVQSQNGELMMKPPGVTQSATSYQLQKNNTATSATFHTQQIGQIGPPTVGNAVSSAKRSPPLQNVRPSQIPPAVSPPIVAPSKSGPPPPKAPTKNGPPRSKPNRGSGVSLDDLLTQSKSREPVPAVKTLETAAIDTSKASSITQPQTNDFKGSAEQIATAEDFHDQSVLNIVLPVAESSFATESTLQSQQSTLKHTQETPSIDELPGDPTNGSEPMPTEFSRLGDKITDYSVGNTRQSEESAPNKTTTEEISEPYVELSSAEERVDHSENSPDAEVDSDMVEPQIPYEVDDGFVSQSQSEMGSTTATPYVVPESVMGHDVPVDIQEKIPEFQSEQQQAQVNHFAPQQHRVSAYAPNNVVGAEPKKSKASGRFTPKSNTSVNDLPVAPSVNTDIDFYSISGYKPAVPVSDSAAEPTSGLAPELASKNGQPSDAVPLPPAQFIQPPQIVSEPTNYQTQSPISSQASPYVTQRRSSSISNPYQPQETHSTTGSTSPPVNSYVPQNQHQSTYSPSQNKFSPYQPVSAEGSSRTPSFSAPPQVVSPQESRFAPMASSESSPSATMSSYAPPSARFTAYEPPKTHPITTIQETNEVYDDFVEDEDSDEDDINTKRSEKKKEKKNKVKEEKKASGSGWLGGWFSKKHDPHQPEVYKAKLGEEISLVYDEKLKRWINPNATEEEKAAATPPPPPPIVKKKPSSIGKPRSDSQGGLPSSLSSPPGGSAPSGLGPSIGGVAPPSGRPGPPPPSMAGASDLDSLLSAGASTRRKKKARGYVDVFQAQPDKK